MLLLLSWFCFSCSLKLYLHESMPNQADIIILKVDLLDDSIVGRRDFGNQFVSEDLTDVIVL